MDTAWVWTGFSGRGSCENSLYKWDYNPNFPIIPWDSQWVDAENLTYNPYIWLYCTGQSRTNHQPIGVLNIAPGKDLSRTIGNIFFLRNMVQRKLGYGIWQGQALASLSRCRLFYPQNEDSFIDMFDAGSNIGMSCRNMSESLGLFFWVKGHMAKGHWPTHWPVLQLDRGRYKKNEPAKIMSVTLVQQCHRNNDTSLISNISNTPNTGPKMNRPK